MRMDAIKDFFGKVRRGAEKLFWPNFDKEGLPHEIREELEVLPQPIQQEFEEAYHLSTSTYRKARNLSVLAFVGLLLFTSSYFGVIGIFIYWLHLRHRRIPETAAQVMEGLRVRYNLKPRHVPGVPGRRADYQSVGAPHRNQPRRILSDYDPSRLTVENLQEGYLVDYNLRTWQVTSAGQSDWDSGLSAREFKLVSDLETIWLYFFKEGSHLTLVVTRPLNIYAIDQRLETQILHSKRPYNILEYQEVQYFRENALEGYQFNLSSKSLGTKILAWEYYDEARRNYLRIEQLEPRNFRAMIGQVVSEFEFSDILPQDK